MRKKRIESLNTKRKKWRYSWPLLVICLVIVSGCVSEMAVASPSSVPVDTIEATATVLVATVTPTSQNESEQESTEMAVEEIIPLTPTPDLRLDPEDWMNWPIVPTMSGRAREIYLSGLAAGRNPRAFSKVGDCQSIREVLLGIYDLPGRYVLRSDDTLLQETIDYFAGSFNRDGYAVKGGFNAATVLSPIWSDPEVCLAGENPLACEFREHNPSMVIISLEVWWDGRTPERYEQYMRKIIEYSISQGVLPILSTKADNVEGDHSINAVSAQLAYEYDIPMWNFWLAAQSLPFQGIDPERDGFHITVDAWNERSYTALKTLDQLWRSANVVENESTVIQATPTATFSDRQTEDFSQVLSQTVDLPGQLVFQLSLNESGGLPYAAGIYRLSFDNSQLTQILSSRYTLLDANGNQILVKDDTNNHIGIFDISGPAIGLNGLSEIISTGGNAVFAGDNSIIVAGMYEESEGIWLADRETGSVKSLVVTKTDTIQLLLARENSVYWVVEGKCGEEKCGYASLYQTNLASLDTTLIVTGGNPTMDSKGENYLYYLTQDDIETIYLSSIKNASDQSQYVGLFGNVLLDYGWAPDSKSVAVLKMVRSDYFGKATDVLHYLVDVDSLVVQELPSVYFLAPKISWFPGGEFVLTSGTMVLGDGEYSIGLRSISMETGAITDIGSSVTIRSENFININQIFWIQ